MKIYFLLILLVYLVIIDDISYEAVTKSPRLRAKQLTPKRKATPSRKPPIRKRRKRGVLFVCAGNVCRSPIAEAVFLDITKKRGLLRRWFVDSAGTQYWNVGRKPDRRALAELAANGIKYDHTSQLLAVEHFEKFEFILAMDQSNLKDIMKIKPPTSKAQVMLFGSFNPKDNNTIIGDPYYDLHHRGFEKCFNLCLTLCKAFLRRHR